VLDPIERPGLTIRALVRAQAGSGAAIADAALA
jgi:hypothetical protein